MILKQAETEQKEEQKTGDLEFEVVSFCKCIEHQLEGSNCSMDEFNVAVSICMHHVEITTSILKSGSADSNNVGG